MKITVAIPCLNPDPALLGEALGSVLREREADPSLVDEILLVDNGSDRPLNPNEGPRWRVIRFEDSPSLAESFNRCWREARGDLVHILHADDLVLPGFYAEILQLAGRYPGRALYATRAWEWATADNSAIQSRDLSGLNESPPEEQAAAFLAGNPLQAPSVVVRKAAYSEHGGFRDKHSHVTDWDCWYRLTRAGGAAFSSQPLAAYRIHAAGGSRSVKAAVAGLNEYLALMPDLWDHPSWDHLAFLSWVAYKAAQALTKAVRAGDEEGVWAAHAYVGRLAAVLQGEGDRRALRHAGL